MKKNILIVLIISISAFIVNASTATEIIEKVDKNQLFKTQAFAGEMIIKKDNRTLVKTFVGYARKKGEKSFIKFTNQEDRGVKYLRIEDELWIYFPDADDIMRISGHMLKQGMMGSDISYEDMLETEKLTEDYSSSLLKDAVVENRSCYVVELKAKHSGAKYSIQKMYVDKKNYVPLKIEMYARGGRLVKVMVQSQVRQIQGRYVAFEANIKDMRQRNSSTTVKFKKLQYNIRIPDYVFSRNYLRK